MIMERALNAIFVFAVKGLVAGVAYGAIFGFPVLFLSIFFFGGSPLPIELAWVGISFGAAIGGILGAFNGVILGIISVIFFKDVFSKGFYRSLLALISMGITFIGAYVLLYELFLSGDMLGTGFVAFLLSLISPVASQHLCWWYLKYLADPGIIPVATQTP
jgi:hypothetical protein